jgi:hypothetical protein
MQTLWAPQGSGIKAELGGQRLIEHEQPRLGHFRRLPRDGHFGELPGEAPVKRDR